VAPAGRVPGRAPIPMGATNAVEKQSAEMGIKRREVKNSCVALLKEKWNTRIFILISYRWGGRFGHIDAIVDSVRTDTLVSIHRCSSRN
jgi:hypothetical protein